MEKKGMSKFEKCLVAVMLVAGLTLAYLATPIAARARLTQESEKQINVSAPSIPQTQLFASVALPAPVDREKTPVIILGSKNTVTVRGVITEESVAKISVELLKKSSELSKNDTIYLVMDTPGGEVEAGKQLITTAQALPQKVKTITIFSASMGFHIVQALDERMILPSGTLMSHRISGGVEGQFPGSAVTRMNMILRDSDEMDAQIAKRVGMSLENYKELIRDEYWVNGLDSVDSKMADKMVLARCSEDLLGTQTISVATLFGDVAVTYSKCPIITGPLAVDLSSLKMFGQNKAEVERYFTLFKSSEKKKFVEEFIITNKFREVLP